MHAERVKKELPFLEKSGNFIHNDNPRLVK
jgi:hypothetical protein